MRSRNGGFAVVQVSAVVTLPAADGASGQPSEAPPAEEVLSFYYSEPVFPTHTMMQRTPLRACVRVCVYRWVGGWVSWWAQKPVRPRKTAV